MLAVADNLTSPGTVCVGPARLARTGLQSFPPPSYAAIVRSRTAVHSVGRPNGNIQIEESVRAGSELEERWCPWGNRRR